MIDSSIDCNISDDLLNDMDYSVVKPPAKFDTSKLFFNDGTYNNIEAFQLIKHLLKNKDNF